MALPVNKISAFLGQTPVGRASVAPSSTSRIVTDSRQIKSGDAFVAISGENRDGHDYITPELIAKCSALIVNKTWFAKRKPVGSAFFPVQDTVLAMLRLTEAYLKT